MYGDCRDLSDSETVELVVHVGEHLKQLSSTPAHTIKRLIVHEEYNYDKSGKVDSKKDIALIELSEEVNNILYLPIFICSKN